MGNREKLLHQLENEKRIQLEKVQLQDIFDRKKSYSVDSDGNVTGLNLSGKSIKYTSFLKNYPTLQYLDLSHNMISDISFLPFLKNLTRLNLSHNEITDISYLNELKILKWVDISNNKLSTIPLDILDWDIEIIWGNDKLSDKLLARDIQKQKTSETDTLVEPPIKHTDIIEDRKTKKLELDEKWQKKILIVSANPKQKNELRIGEEMKAIIDCLKHSKFQDNYLVHIAHEIRIRDFQQELLDNKPNIVQFIGHGTKNGLMVVDELGLPVIFPSEALVKLLMRFSDHLECVIFNSCYSSSQAKEISKQIDYVIGMEESIPDSAAIEFSVGFYGALGAGESYESAFEFGKIAILSKFPGENKHSIPILYLKQIRNPPI